MPALWTVRSGIMLNMSNGAGHIVGGQILILLWGSISDRMLFSS